ncbi:MAG: FtsW/RodA/SpoVE family cell cycle protein, partial [Alphaproteobacteria bacterium]
MSVFDLSRSNRTPLGKWWWTVDWWILVSLFLLLGVGVLFVLAASPAVAQQHAWSTFYFVKRHLILFFPSVLLMVGISLLNLRQIRRLALMLFGFSLCLLVAVLVVGAEIKGARRWMNVLGFSLQPSEFIKPALIILC